MMRFWIRGLPWTTYDYRRNDDNDNNDDNGNDEDNDNNDDNGNDEDQRQTYTVAPRWYLVVHSRMK